jgi:hypothetical protein
MTELAQLAAPAVDRVAAVLAAEVASTARDAVPVRLRCVTGDIVVRLPAGLSADGLNWPAVTPQAAGPLPPRAAWELDVVVMSSAVESGLAGLPGPDWQRCDRSGRASFPAAWLAGPYGRAVLYGQERHLVVRHGSRVLLAVRPGHDPARWAQRTLRQLVVRSGQRTGLRLVHAAVLASGTGGVLIVGASGAGKTDLALRAARHSGAVVSVDRCLVGVVDGELLACAVPFGFNIAEATLGALGVGATDLVGVRPAVLAKRYLDVDEVRRLCRVPVVDRCRVTGLVRLDGPRAGAPATVGHMSPAETATVLADELSYVDPGFHTDWLGVLDGAVPPSGPAARTAALAGLRVAAVPGSAGVLAAVRGWVAAGTGTG